MSQPQALSGSGILCRRLTAVMAIGLALVVVGGSLFNILPLMTAGAADKLGFSGRQAGLLSSVLTAASGLGCLLSGAWVRTLRWPRAAAVSLAGMFIANVATLFVHDYTAFVLMQAVAAFFASAAFSLGMTVISDGHESARNFGIAIAVQAAYQIAALWAGPSLLRLSGLDGILLLLALPAGLVIVLAPLLPGQGRPSAARQSVAGLLMPSTLLAFAGFFIFYMGAGAYWTYLELMGQAAGMTARTVADWAAAGVAAGIPAGMLASAQGHRFGSLRPLGGAGLLMLIAAILLSGAYGSIAFGIAGMLYYFAWCYSLSYQFALVNAVDPTGRAVAVTGACAFFGSAAGAAFAALFVTPNDYRAVIWMVAAAACLSPSLYALARAVHRRA
jgi:predicted MFS family arabinose efflux permease